MRNNCNNINVLSRDIMAIARAGMMIALVTAED